MNVKPGDFARIVKGAINIGAVVYVLEPCELDATYWWVELLQEGLGHSFFSPGHGFRRIRAGTIGTARDTALQRIDPPEDTDETPTTTPKELEHGNR